MQIDYKLICFILGKMQENEINFICVKDLLDNIIELHEQLYNFFDKDKLEDLFIGYLHLLKDEGLIQELYGCNLGVFYTPSEFIFFKCFIRLTSKGYDFLKFLSFSEPFESLNEFTLSQVIKMSKNYL